MPGGDGTGPMGTGPMTGRAAGYCAGYAMPGYANPIGGRGRGFWGRGRGGAWGRGWGLGFGIRRFGWVPMGSAYPPYGPAAPTRDQELETLKQQASYFQSALADIQKRIDELDAQTK